MSADIKQRLAADEVLIGAWVSVPSPLVVDALGTCGFDWMAVDMEHGAVDAGQAETLFIAAERRNMAPMARLPSADPYLARRLLDAGARGILVPVVESAAAFENFAVHCLYPPHGKRGVGLSRANRWGDDFREYFQGFSPLLVPQIETVAGVEAAAGIAALPMVDALFVGPYDLSASLGEAGNFESAAFLEAMETLKAACKEHGKALGGHQVEPDKAKLESLIDDGFRFIAYGTDIIAMRHAFAGLKDR
ncbi:MAG TPA: 2,4-dihydroxyhept-2-ene-1,7-dioic acid aldolase [Alphaproteobacteria bacterium]|nr:2,4-dihydroxyhept-2-ene-1,7-dioic acid aldolase [Alphaproteobacteria bacterium]